MWPRSLSSTRTMFLTRSYSPTAAFPFSATASIRLRLGAEQTRFRAILPDGEIEIVTRLVGRFNVSNCLAAIAATSSLGISPELIAEALATVQGVTGRMERIDEGQP